MENFCENNNNKLTSLAFTLPPENNCNQLKIIYLETKVFELAENLWL